MISKDCLVKYCRCEECGKDFWAREGKDTRFCGRVCRNKFNMRTAYKPTDWKNKVKVCKGCGSEFKPTIVSQMYCRPECRPSFTKDRFSIFERDRFRCVYCGKTSLDGIELHVDHIVPKKLGGNDMADNLVTACIECNLGKCAMAMMECNVEYYKSYAKKANLERGISGIMNIKTNQQ